MTESNSIRSHYWGLLDYEACEKLQASVFDQVLNEDLDGVILGGEIKPAITQGVRASEADILSAENFEIFKIKRGGETTLHSPGQLVIYPVLNIRKLGLGVRNFVQTLLHVSQITFQHFGVPAQALENPVGLFTIHGKIGFCGLQISKGICQHGLSLNIQNNLKLFDQIVSCGLKKATYDKLENYNPAITPEEFFKAWVAKAFLEGSLRKNQIQVEGSIHWASSSEVRGGLESPVQDR